VVSVGRVWVAFAGPAKPVIARIHILTYSPAQPRVYNFELRKTLVLKSVLAAQ